MKKPRIFHDCVLILLVLCLALSGCAVSDAGAAAQPSTEPVPETTQPPAKPQSISVALYPYVPDMELFQDVLARMWADIEADIALEFVDWDCFTDPSPDGIDIITYDALFTSYLAENGFIQPLDPEYLDNTEGIIPFALDGSQYNGDLYGLPFLVCSYFLIHRTDDEAMWNVENFADLCEEISARQQVDPSAGLQMNYISDYPYYYLDALIDFSGTYTTYTEVPDLASPDEDAMQMLHRIRSVLAKTSAESDGTLHEYRTRFDAGEGSAIYDFSESLYDMPNSMDNLTIRPISFSETENIQLFYADIASLGTHVTDPAEKEACLKLIDLIGSEEFQNQLCFGSGETQYMLPASRQVYLDAQEEAPIYSLFYTLATDEHNRIVRFGPGIWDYLNVAYEALQ